MTTTTTTYTRPVDPAASFRFSVVVDSVTVASFSDVSGLEASCEPLEYFEGGLNTHTRVFPGQYKFGSVTLKRGVSTEGTNLWSWIKSTVTGSPVLHSVTIKCYDQNGTTEIQSWTLVDAFPVKWSASGFSSNTNDIVIEELTLAHQGMDWAQ